MHIDAKSREKHIRALGQVVTDLTVAKNLAYGDSFHTTGEALKLLWPDGIPVAAYGDALLIARLWDKMGRIANDPDAFGEDPRQDICGYGLVAATNRLVAEEASTSLAEGEGGPSVGEKLSELSRKYGATVPVEGVRDIHWPFRVDAP